MTANAKDPYRELAAKMFLVTPEEVTDSQRRAAKRTCFNDMYSCPSVPSPIDRICPFCGCKHTGYESICTTCIDMLQGEQHDD